MLEGNANLKKDQCNQTNPKNENEIQHPPLKPLQKMILKKQYVKKNWTVGTQYQHPIQQMTFLQWARSWASIKFSIQFFFHHPPPRNGFYIQSGISNVFPASM